MEQVTPTPLGRQCRHYARGFAPYARFTLLVLLIACRPIRSADTRDFRLDVADDSGIEQTTPQAILPQAVGSEAALRDGRIEIVFGAGRAGCPEASSALRVCIPAASMAAGRAQATQPYEEHDWADCDSSVVSRQRWESALCWPFAEQEVDVFTFRGALRTQGISRDDLIVIMGATEPSFLGFPESNDRPLLTIVLTTATGGSRIPDREGQHCRHASVSLESCWTQGGHHLDFTFVLCADAVESTRPRGVAVTCRVEHGQPVVVLRR